MVSVIDVIRILYPPREPHKIMVAVDGKQTIVSSNEIFAVKHGELRIPVCALDDESCWGTVIEAASDDILRGNIDLFMLPGHDTYAPIMEVLREHGVTAEHVNAYTACNIDVFLVQKDRHWYLIVRARGPSARLAAPLINALARYIAVEAGGKVYGPHDPAIPVPSLEHSEDREAG